MEADMNFVGTGRRLAQGDVGDAARVLGIETAVLLAFLEVEAAGRGFDSKNRPKMLFEPHVFWRNLAGKLRDAAAAAGLAYAKWKRNYPADSYPRLEKAISIAREPGFRSASYGLPQILGENHKAAGFSSAEAMFSTMKQGEREQLLAMVALLSDWGLAAALRGKDFSKPESWVTAVKRYNGPGYAANGYHTKAAGAYVKHAQNIDAATGQPLPPKVLVPPASAVLSKGMKGEAVRALQADLQSLGYVFAYGIDGRFGDETHRAVLSFQQSHGLWQDGKAGSETQKAIAAALAGQEGDASPPPPTWPGQGDKPPPSLPWPIILFLIGLAAAGLFVALNLKVF
jgi:hypothetical protein